MTSSKRILVTGATGFLGSRTVERLSSMPSVFVVATGRTLKPHNQIEAENVVYKLGELTDSKFVEEIVEGVDCIIHAAALSSPWGKKKDFWNSNVLPTQLLLDEAENNSVKRFIFISSPSMYFEMKPLIGIKEEDSLPTPINHYAASKQEAEELVRKSEVAHVILRPRALVGRGDTVILPRILRAHKEKTLRQIGNGMNSVDITPVVNVVDAILLSLDASERALNETYNISNGDPVKLWPMVKKVFEKLSLPPLTKSISVPKILIIARLMEFYYRWFKLNQEPALTVYGVGTVAMDFSMDISKAKELLGYKPSQTVDEAINEFIDWHITTTS